MKHLDSHKKYNPSFQGRENEIFLKKILQRKRKATSTRAVIRRYGLLFKIIVIFGSISLVGYYLYRFLDDKGYMSIKTVEITGAVKFVNASDVKILAENFSLGKNIIVFDTKNLENTLNNNFLGARTFLIEKKYPGTIFISVEERIPLAVISDLDSDSSYLIDADGYVLGEVGNNFSELPKVKYDGEVKVGSFVEKDVVPVTIEILKNAEEDSLKVSSMSFSPKYTRLFVESGTEVLIGNEKNKDDSLHIVSTLLKKLSLEGKKVTKIDLRYDKVIVSYD